MEQPAKESFISQELVDGLQEDQLAEYKEIKENLRDLLSKEGAWSSELNVWIDRNLGNLGMIGKSLEAISNLNRSKRKTHQVKKDLQHYKSIYQMFIEKSPDCPESFLAWVEKALPDSLEDIGVLLDYAGKKYISLRANKMVREWADEK